jgi:hypothetical protein
MSSAKMIGWHARDDGRNFAGHFAVHFKQPLLLCPKELTSNFNRFRRKRMQAILQAIFKPIAGPGTYGLAVRPLFDPGVLRTGSDQEYPN